MDFLEAVKTCLFSKYVTFSGRACRSEYWYFMLFSFLLQLALMMMAPLAWMAWILLLIPSFSVGARRLHDVGRSGWWQLLAITVIGVFVLLYWWVKPGDAGDNKHGSNQLQTLPE